jgi:hypothetical protein
MKVGRTLFGGLNQQGEVKTKHGHTLRETRKTNMMGQNNLGWSENTVNEVPKRITFSYIFSLTDSSIPTFLYLFPSLKAIEKNCFSFFSFATYSVLTFPN